jgi:hypothetical protein
MKLVTLAEVKPSPSPAAGRLLRLSGIESGKPLINGFFGAGDDLMGQRPCL